MSPQRYAAILDLLWALQLWNQGESWSPRPLGGQTLSQVHSNLAVGAPSAREVQRDSPVGSLKGNEVPPPWLRQLANWMERGEMEL